MKYFITIKLPVNTIIITIAWKLSTQEINSENIRGKREQYLLITLLLHQSLYTQHKSHNPLI